MNNTRMGHEKVWSWEGVRIGKHEIYEDVRGYRTFSVYTHTIKGRGSNPQSLKLDTLPTMYTLSSC